jgi:flagellar biogenesis protein FliO
MKYIAFIITLFICSCSLFKKTSRSSDITKKSSLNQLESSQLVLKNIGNETQIFTYWNDSGFYQYQFIREQSKEQTATQLKSKEIQDVKEKQTIKKAEPIGLFGYIVFLVVLFIIGYFLIKKF